MKIKYSLVFIFFSLFINTTLFSQWVKLPNSLNAYLKDIKTINDNNIFTIGHITIEGQARGKVFHTIDGGMTWDTIISIEDTFTWLENIKIVDDENIYISSINNRIYKTINGGLDWDTIQYSNYGNGAVQAMDFLNNDIGLIGNYSGQIFKTIDAGESWTELYDHGFSTWSPIYEIDCPLDSICFGLVDHNPANELVRIIKTYDGGTSWTLIPEGFAGVNLIRPNGLFSINSDTIIVVGRNMLRSLDGGYTWEESFINGQIGDVDIGDVEFIGNIGYAVGEQETILKSIDYGASWTIERHVAGSDETILGLDMISINSVIACSTKGNIFRYGNSVSSFNNQLSTKDNINIFPIPFSNKITIDFNKEMNGKIIIYNFLGVKIKEIKIINKHTFDISMHNINSDIIIQFIDNDSNNSYSKIILKK